ncbi:MAG TPA: hypothetical protein PL117_12680, partial [Accumulibacter sp.]|nr:hypothetical protein [Accumulibacter sp.]
AGPTPTSPTTERAAAADAALRASSLADLDSQSGATTSTATAVPLPAAPAVRAAPGGTDRAAADTGEDQVTGNAALPALVVEAPIAQGATSAAATGPVEAEAAIERSEPAAADVPIVREVAAAPAAPTTVDVPEVVEVANVEALTVTPRLEELVAAPVVATPQVADGAAVAAALATTTATPVNRSTVENSGMVMVETSKDKTQTWQPEAPEAPEATTTRQPRRKRSAPAVADEPMVMVETRK